MNILKRFFHKHFYDLKEDRFGAFFEGAPYRKVLIFECRKCGKLDTKTFPASDKL